MPTTLSEIPIVSQQPTVILIGAGHVHLHIVAQAEKLIAQGARVVLIDPDQFWYSGMATGMLGGMYTSEDDRVDPQALITANGGEFLRAKEAGRVEDGHVAAEIGEVFAGIAQGRRSDAEITVYKSLGHAVQDVAAAAWLAGRALKERAA
jgi:hypothetical protein